MSPGSLGLLLANIEPVWHSTLRLGAPTFQLGVLCGPPPPQLSSFAYLRSCVSPSNSNVHSCGRGPSFSPTLRWCVHAAPGAKKKLQEENLKSFQLRHFWAWSPLWYAALMTSKQVTNAIRNCPLKNLGTACKLRTLNRNSACRSTMSIASKTNRPQRLWGCRQRIELLLLPLQLHYSSHPEERYVVTVGHVWSDDGVCPPNEAQPSPSPLSMLETLSVSDSLT